MKLALRSTLYFVFPVLFIGRECFSIVLTFALVGFALDGLPLFRQKSRFLILLAAVGVAQLVSAIFSEWGHSSGTVFDVGGFRIVKPEFVQKSLEVKPWIDSIGRVSFIITAYEETPLHIQKTIESIVEATIIEAIEEIIVVDDASTIPVSTAALKPEVAKFVRVIRNPTRQGVVRSKLAAAATAKGVVYMFMDAHMKPEKGWLTDTMRLLNANYKCIVAPVILKLDPYVWENDAMSTSYKMLFNWDFDLQWVDDSQDEIPILSGGVFAVTKAWWAEFGEYDRGFQEYGMENLEISLRAWLCGGEILLARRSRIGHVFKDKFPYRISSVKLDLNRLLAIELWVDEEHKEEFYARHPEFKSSKTNNAIDKSAVTKIKNQLSCLPFSFFLHRFKDIFQMEGLIELPQFTIRISEKCLDSSLKIQPCVESELLHWAWIYGNGLFHQATKLCLDAAGGAKNPITKHCEKDNLNQAWSMREGMLRWGSHCLQDPNNGESASLELCGMNTTRWTFTPA